MKAGWVTMRGGVPRAVSGRVPILKVPTELIDSVGDNRLLSGQSAASFTLTAKESAHPKSSSSLNS